MTQDVTGYANNVDLSRLVKYINVLVSSFRFNLVLCYGSTVIVHFPILSVRLQYLDILTYKDGPRAQRVELIADILPLDVIAALTLLIRMSSV